MKPLIAPVSPFTERRSGHAQYNNAYENTKKKKAPMIRQVDNP